MSNCARYSTGKCLIIRNDYVRMAGDRRCQYVPVILVRNTRKRLCQAWRGRHKSFWKRLAHFSDSVLALFGRELDLVLQRMTDLLKYAVTP
jgi:hypothetical protein